MRWRPHICRLLIFGGNVQLVISVASALGLSGAAALGVARIVTPSTFWEYLFVACVFAASLPVTFPLAAYAMNFALAKVEASRQRNLFDDPVETARKRVDVLIAEAQSLYDDLPDRPTPGEINYHRERIEHWVVNADREVGHGVGRYAGRYVSVSDNPTAWKGFTPWGFDIDSMRAFVGERINRLRSLREQLPMDRRKWLRYSVGLDIAAGRSLTAFLEKPPDPHAAEYGAAELETWAEGVNTVFRQDAPDSKHICAPETYQGLTSPQARAEYVAASVTDLEHVWKAL